MIGRLVRRQENGTDSASETGSAEARGRIRTAELILIMVQRRNRKMQIFVDADACPVVAIIEKIAKENSIPVTLLCDTNHVLSSAYSEVIVVGAGADAVDYKLISICHKGDIVVSQDYGVAAMALGKGAYAIHQSGKWYTNDNIDQMHIRLLFSFVFLSDKVKRTFQVRFATCS